jgi:RNA polymerase sigma factor (sigma-70 family)
MHEDSHWQLFLKGDENALAFFFRKYHPDLFRYGMKLCGNSDIVKDSIQEMFLKLWKNREFLSDIKNAKPYLFKALRRHIQTNLEMQLKYSTLDNSSLCFLIEFSSEDFVIEGEEEKENCKKVLDVLNQLGHRQREAIYLRFFENLDFTTISQIMDLNVQSVRHALHRGLQTMRELMTIESFLFLMAYKLAI